MGGTSIEDELSIFGLISDGDCSSDFDKYGGFLLMSLVILYTFKVLASICDGHLTTCLEKIVEKFGIPEDVAGATFLAMSSSAPELFHSIVSTFVLVSPSGVGNIVGSALFNLLCIIGVLPLCSKTGPLKIWWYPTMRDACFYSLAVAELLLVILDAKVVWWEALIMVLSYLSYVIYFYFNERIVERFDLDPGSAETKPAEREAQGVPEGTPSPSDRSSPSDAKAYLDRRWSRRSGETSESTSMVKQLSRKFKDSFASWEEAFVKTDVDANGIVDKDELSKMIQTFDIDVADSILDEVFMEGDLNQDGRVEAYEFASVFWDGAVLLRGADSTQPLLKQLDRARHSVQQKFESAEGAFKATDSDGSGCVDLAKLKALLGTLELDGEEKMQEEIFRAVDINCDGWIQLSEFQTVIWEGKLLQGGESTVTKVSCIKEVSALYHEKFSSCAEAFKTTDTNNSGAIEIDELRAICGQLTPHLDHEQIQELFRCCDFNQSGGIELHEFQAVLWDGRLLGLPQEPAEGGLGDDEEEEESGVCERYDPSLIIINMLMPPFRYLVLAFTVVVFWVAFFTYFMVDAANRLGCFTQVPHVVMGLIVLAAGTSVPDMVASMAVARAGSADMAAANAVGSNTFDILLGLGLPWLIRCVAYDEEIQVPRDELIESIGILGFSLFFYLAILRFNGWVLNRVIGGALLSIYASAVAFILIRHYTHFKHLDTYGL